MERKFCLRVDAKSSARENATDSKEDAAIIGNHRQTPTPPKFTVKSQAGQDYGQLDDIVGDFGNYQFLIFMFKILIGATSAFNNLGVTFYAPTDFVSFWCADTAALAAPNATSSSHQYALASPTHGVARPDGQLQHRQPIVSSLGGLQQIFGDFLFSEERKMRHQSVLFNHDTPRHIRKECSYLSPIDGLEHKCTSYQYDRGIWMSTIIDEWNLVCDRSWYISMSQSLYMAGFILSYLIFGHLSDRFGRWRSLVLGALIEILSGFGCALAPSIGLFMAFRFLLGLGNAGRSSSSYLIMIEWIGPRWRMHMSTLGSLGWAVGYCVMPWIVLYYLHFRHMQLFVCFYELTMLIWLLRLPESPRWLLTHRRYEEAHEVLLMAARFNGLIIENENQPGVNGMATAVAANQQQQPPLLKPTTTKERYIATLTDLGNTLKQKITPSGDSSKELAGACAMDLDSDSDLCQVSATKGKSIDGNSDRLLPYNLAEFNAKFQRLANTIEAKEFTSNEDKLNILDLFKWKNLRKYMLILSFAWAANSFIYYGIVLNVGDFGASNLFWAFTYAGITELPSILFTMVCMKFLPRRSTNILLFGSILLLCSMQIPLKYYKMQRLQQATMMLAKFFNACSFTCILYQTMELFPTSIRQTAYSSCSLAGRVGSILAPFIKELSQRTNAMVPPAIYTVLSVIQIALVHFLPETQGSDLPDTLLEAEKFKGTDKMTTDDSNDATTNAATTTSSHADDCESQMGQIAFTARRRPSLSVRR